MTIEGVAYARAGLAGNPSDGYFGKTVSFTIRDFEAKVTLDEASKLEIIPCFQDRSTYASIHDLVRDVEQQGYYGGVRLMKATVRRFVGYCKKRGIDLHDRNFTLQYDSTIPRRVGLAGSSALVMAALRSLMAFYGVDIPKPVQPGIALSVEDEELGIAAGLQDRVIQVYGNCVFMDFNQALMDSQGHGNYEELDPALLPNLFIAYRTRLSEGSEVFHNTIRERWLNGDPDVVQAMEDFAQYAKEVRDLLVAGRGREIGPWLDKNFERRRSIFKIGQGNIDMVERARSAGTNCKFAGSGGAIVGIYDDEAMYGRLQEVFEGSGTIVMKPRIVD